MAESIGNPLLDRFIKDLIVQMLAMIPEQERTESKRRQDKGIEIAKKMGYINVSLYFIRLLQNIHKNVVFINKL